MDLAKPKHSLLSFVFLGSLGVTSAMAAPENNDEKPSKAPGSYKLRASFDKPKYFMGENALLTFSIENTGKEPITIETGGDYRNTVRATRFHVKAERSDGSVAPDPHPNAAMYCMGGLGGPKKLSYTQRAEFTLSLPVYARIEKPGKYKVSVSHDLGWELPPDKSPTAVAEVDFEDPSPEEARQIVEQMYKLPEFQAGSSGKRHEEYQDFSTLSYPVYLPPLLDKAQHGSAMEGESALTAIANIASPEATTALINIAKGKNKKLASSACQYLAMRLPDPELKGQLPKRNIFEVSYDSERERLVKKSWQENFAPAVRELGNSLLKSADQREQGLGAFMLQCVGDKGSIQTLLPALDKAINSSKTLPLETSIYPRPRGNVAELMRTACVLAKPDNISTTPP